MTAAEFRALALELPATEQRGHMGHPDFRVGGKVFASLGYPDGGHGMVKLGRDEQEALLQARPTTFRAAAGAWGAQGATVVMLAAADADAVRDALAMAWRRTAPARVRREHPELADDFD